MYLSIALVILIVTNIGLLILFHRKGEGSWREIFRYFLGGMMIAIIIKGFVYGIGREMNIDFYFFEVRILGKNAFENFQESYISFINNISLHYNAMYALGAIILPAALEEIGKLGALRVTTAGIIDNEISTIRRYIYGMFIIALGFSFLENLFYMGYYLEKGFFGGDLIQLMTLRIIMSTSSHLLFSGVIAYYYARFFFGKYDLVETGGFMTHKKIVAFLKKIHLFYAPFFLFAYNSRLLFMGIFLAIAGHIFYNLMIYIQRDFFALIFLFFGWIGFAFFILENNLLDKNLGLIQQKIHLMKEMRKIQKQKDELFGKSEK